MHPSTSSQSRVTRLKITAACGAALLGLTAAAVSVASEDGTYYPPAEASAQPDFTPPTGSADIAPQTLIYAGHMPSGWGPTPTAADVYGPAEDMVISPPANGMPDSTESDHHDHESSYGGYYSAGPGYAPVQAQARAGE